MTANFVSTTRLDKVFSTPAVAIVLPLVLGSGLGLGPSQQQVETDYKALKKPFFAPPGWIFGPVWVVLYTLMGYGSYRASITGMASLNPQTVELASQGTILYIVQFGLNMLFIPLFFGWKRRGLATADIVLMTLAVGWLIKIWSQVDELAAWCLVPYVAWLSLASCVTVSIGYLNDWYFGKKASTQM